MAAAVDMSPLHHHNHHPHHNNHHHQRTSSLPHPPLPASPTLTDPDMILPDYEEGSRSTTPTGAGWKESLPLEFRHQLASLQLDSGIMAANAFIGFPTGPVTPTTPIMYGHGTMLSDIGEVTEAESAVGGDRVGPAGTRHNGGIGTTTITNTTATTTTTTTTATSTTATTTTTTATAAAGYAYGSEDGGRMVTPTLVKNRLKAAAASALQHHRRNDSIDSNSTVTTDDHRRNFAALDDVASVADSACNGDDEDSVTSSYYDGSSTPPPPPPPPPRPRKIEMERPLDRYSTATLSKRAEAILATAKKRLTNMEDNLHRARSSLSSSGLSSGLSSPSPDSFMLASAGINESSFRTALGSRHYRGLSEDSGQPASVAEDHAAPTLQTRRATSAMGTAATRGFRPLLLLTSSRSTEFSRIRSPGIDVNLGPLPEDMTILTEEKAGLEGGRDDGSEGGGQAHGPAALLLSPTSSGSPYSDRSLSRCGSAQQSRSVRDLKDQMNGLKGKIYSLRDQARADSLKRRSIQNMRTPSPFTHAGQDHGYVGDGSKNAQQELTPPTSAAMGKVPWRQEEDGEGVDGDGRARAGEEGADGLMAVDVVAGDDDDNLPTPTRTHPHHQFDHVAAAEMAEAGAEAATELRSARDEEIPDRSAGRPHPHAPPQVEDEDEDPAQSDCEYVSSHEELDSDDTRTETGSVHAQEDDESVYDSEGGESLYHDTVQMQISHEDRADAFDYEHFFLHSAMGTISQERLMRQRRQRSGTTASACSVETTRPIPIPTSTRPPSAKLGGRDSVMTVQSFETARSSTTADESFNRDGGEESEKEDEVEEEVEEDEVEEVKEAEEVEDADGEEAGEEEQEAEEEGQEAVEDQASHSTVSTLPRPATSQANISQRPSTGSLESGTAARSFPLVNRPHHRKGTMSVGHVPAPPPPPAWASARVGVPGPSGSTDDMRVIAGSLVDSAARASALIGGGSPASQEMASDFRMQEMLSRDDQVMVERLVASLGRCVLGLGEAGRATAQSRMLRRRIDAARRILDGFENQF